MTTTLVRGFVLFLAVSGFGASTIPSKTSTSKPVVKTNDLPLCWPPTSPNFCGID